MTELAGSGNQLMDRDEYHETADGGQKTCQDLLRQEREQNQPGQQGADWLGGSQEEQVREHLATDSP